MENSRKKKKAWNPKDEELTQLKGKIAVYQVQNNSGEQILKNIQQLYKRKEAERESWQTELSSNQISKRLKTVVENLINNTPEKVLSAGVGNYVSRKMGDNSLSNQKTLNIEEEEEEEVEEVLRNDSIIHNIRTVVSCLSNHAKMFFVTIPNYSGRQEAEPKVETTEAGMLISYTFKARDSTAMYNFYNTGGLVPQNYANEVRASLLKCSWTVPFVSEIFIKFPFPVTSVKRAVHADWIAYRFFEKFQVKEAQTVVVGD